MYDKKLSTEKSSAVTIEASLTTDFYKILLLGDEEQLNAFETMIPDSWREEFYVVRSQKYLIEVLKKRRQ